MSWISNLFSEMNELITVISSKLNTLNTNKEDKANKQGSLTSTNADHYPNVPAVSTGLTNTLQSAQTYTDSKIQQNNANYIPIAQKAVAGGVATLDGSGKIPGNQLPPLAISDTFPVANQAQMLALNAQVGDVAIRSDVSKSFILRVEPASVLANWNEFLTPNSGVQSVDMTMPVGLQVTGGPVTSNGTFIITYQAGYSMVPNAKQTEYNAAYQHSIDMGNANTAIPDWSTALQTQTPGI